MVGRVSKYAAALVALVILWIPLSSSVGAEDPVFPCAETYAWERETEYRLSYIHDMIKAMDYQDEPWFTEDTWTNILDTIKDQWDAQIAAPVPGLVAVAQLAVLFHMEVVYDYAQAVHESDVKAIKENEGYLEMSSELLEPFETQGCTVFNNDY